MPRAKEVTAKMPSYEQFIAFYSSMQEIEKFYTLAEIQNAISFMYLSLIANQLDVLPELKVKIMAEKLTFLIEFFEQLDRLRPE